MPIKRRSYVGYSQNYRFGTSSLNNTGTVTLLNNEELVTHSNDYRRLGHSNGNIGNSFQLTRTSHSVTGAHYENKSLPRKFLGEVYCTNVLNAAGGSMPGLASLAALNSWGTTAIARVLPTNPSAGLSTFIGELREGIPHIVGSSLFRGRIGELRKLPGDEYLNVQFGWAPMVSDLKSFAYSIKNHNQILNQYRRGSDTKIKRRYIVPGNPSTVVSATGTGLFGPDVGYTQLSGTATQSTETYDQRWFEGAFRYHIPVGSSALDKFHRYESYANYLLGTRITPEVIWNISPWTWFADWFANTGDIIHNISALGSDGLAMQYGYVMSHKRSTQRTLASVTVGGKSLFSQYTLLQERKQRVPGTPYGFGLTVGDFTNRQLAIMAALGMSYT